MHDAEKVKRFGVLRLAGQQVMIAAGRVRVAARLVKLQSGGQVRIRMHGDIPRNDARAFTPRL